MPKGYQRTALFCREHEENEAHAHGRPWKPGPHCQPCGWLPAEQLLRLRPACLSALHAGRHAAPTSGTPARRDHPCSKQPTALASVCEEYATSSKASQQHMAWPNATQPNI